MLVLTRKQKETIKIGDDITITILRLKGQQVRVGIEAPRDMRVTRGELAPLVNAALASSNSEIESADDQADVNEFGLSNVPLPVGVSLSGNLASDPQPQVLQFRFAREDRQASAAAERRGPLAGFRSVLHSEGCVIPAATS